jgi:hypothetical protein
MSHLNFSPKTPKCIEPALSLPISSDPAASKGKYPFHIFSQQCHLGTNSKLDGLSTNWCLDQLAP